MATAVSAMADDWEYIDNDTFSVISLLSDDDALEPSRGSEAVGAVASLTDDPINPCHRSRSESPTPNDSKPSDTNTEPNGARTVGGRGTDQPDAVEPDTPCGQREKGALRDGGFNDICEKTSSLIKRLGELLSTLDVRDESHGPFRHIRATCELLISQLDWIRDTWRIHARAKAHHPIGLYEWINSLEAELQKIQRKLKGPRIQDTSNSNMAYISQANAWHRAIEGLRVQMDGMITVLQSDFLNRSALISESGENSPTTNHKSPLRYPTCVTTGSAHLNRELHALRTQIVACLGEIQSYEHHGIYDFNQLLKMAESGLNFTKIKESLERALSTPEPSWVSPVRGLTYHQFRQINPDAISSLTLELKDVTDALFNERTKVRARRRRDGRLNYEKLLVSQSGLDSLYTIEQNLFSIFRIPRK